MKKNPGHVPVVYPDFNRIINENRELKMEIADLRLNLAVLNKTLDGLLKERFERKNHETK